MKFNSQICTTKEQSERLLALGLKKDTADMEIHEFLDDDKEIFEVGFANQGYMEPEMEETVICSPAWSLHRLIEMMPTLVNPIRNLFVSNRCVEYQMSEGRTTHVFANENNIYDNVINCIERLISVDEFNKEYLKK